MPDNIDFVLGRLEGKVDALLASHNETKTRLNDQDERISAIEQKIAYVAGGFALASFLISTIIDKVL